MSYFEERLPSNGERTVQLREYRVSDAIVVSSMNPKLVERITSKFLSVIQTGENIIDPKTEMTIADRQTLLFKYALLSLQDRTMTDQEEYTIKECNFCGEEHKFRLSIEDFRALAKTQIISKAEVLTEFEGKRLLITPLMGIHAEQLEMFENNLKRIKESAGEESDQYQAERIKRDLHKLLCQFTLVDEMETDLSNKEKAERDKNWLYGLPQSALEGLMQLIMRKQEEIKHGIDFTWTYTCPKTEGQVVSLLPFRFENFIPRI